LKPPGAAKTTKYFVTFRRVGSGRFLKKAAQKLLLCWVMGFVADKPMAQIHKVFLLLFVHKKKPCPCLPPCQRTLRARHSGV
jgi:hypothetical protein